MAARSAISDVSTRLSRRAEHSLAETFTRLAADRGTSKHSAIQASPLRRPPVSLGGGSLRGDALFRWWTSAAAVVPTSTSPASTSTRCTPSRRISVITFGIRPSFMAVGSATSAPSTESVVPVTTRAREARFLAVSPRPRVEGVEAVTPFSKVRRQLSLTSRLENQPPSDARSGAMLSLAALASRHLSDTLLLALEHPPEGDAVLMFDERSELSRLLVGAYRGCLPQARPLDFDRQGPEAVRAVLEQLRAGALAVLIQSSVLRMPEFRTRVELYRRSVKVVEHANLDRIEPHQLEHYVAALAYDPLYYREVGHALKALMDAASAARVVSGGEELHFDGPLEPAKLNIGHFAGLQNVGSQFPIGEVFSEARDLERVHGRVQIYAFADTSFRLNVPAQPITLVIARGRVVETLNATPEFTQVLSAIRSDEGQVWLRELGFGMNRAFSRERYVSDVGAFERVCGVHLSLGAKHGVYKKPSLNPREARHHVDTFVVTDQVWLDERLVFADGGWRATPLSQ